MTPNTHITYNFTNAYAGTGNQKTLFSHEVTTWQNDKFLDDVYEKLRQQHYAKKTLKLHSNYDQTHVKEVSAKSIYWNQQGEPKIVCSIVTRSCWPNHTYRVLNRLWKPMINTGGVKTIDIGFALLLKSQLEWCNRNDARAVFMSRSIHGNWAKWAANFFKKQLGIELHHPAELFLTCDNEKDESCWQQILIHGDLSVLNSWRHKNP